MTSAIALIVCAFIASACGYFDAYESDLAFRTGKASEGNPLLRRFARSSTPSLHAMLIFNSIYQFLFALPAIITRSPTAAYFGATILFIAGAKHLTQAYWGFCLNTGRPTPAVAKWFQKWFWDHDGVED